MDHAPIRPFLVDQPLQQMRQDGGRHDAQSQMIGLPALTLVAGARSQPQASRDHIEQVFIGGPGQQPSRPLHGGACVACNGLCDPPVELRRAEMPPRHGRNLPRGTNPSRSSGSRDPSFFNERVAGLRSDKVAASGPAKTRSSARQYASERTIRLWFGRPATFVGGLLACGGLACVERLIADTVSRPVPFRDNRKRFRERGS